MCLNILSIDNLIIFLVVKPTAAPTLPPTPPPPPTIPAAQEGKNNIVDFLDELTQWLLFFQYTALNIFYQI